ncbi:MAG: hypothetical protein AAGD11_02505 [Planctomycetota bacterium]
MAFTKLGVPVSIVLAIATVPCLAQSVVLQDWQFDDVNGTNLNVVANTGTLGTAFNFGGPSTQNGTLNLGDTPFFKWDVGTGTTFRTASFPDITSGQHVFEFVIADWNFGGSIGETNNGIKFNFGDSTLGSAQLEFEIAQAPGDDIRVRSQNSNNGNLSGTDAQNQLGGLDLTNTNSVTVQLHADLDTGAWSTQVDAGSDGSFVDLVTDGTGMNSIDRIQLVVDGGANGWDFAGVQGTAGDFIQIDSITLTDVTNALPPPVVEINSSTATSFTFGSFNSQPTVFDTTGENIVINDDYTAGLPDFQNGGVGYGFNGQNIDFDASTHALEIEARLLGDNAADRFRILLSDNDGDDTMPFTGTEDYVYFVDTSDFNASDFSTLTIPLGSGTEDGVQNQFGSNNAGDGLQNFGLNRVALQSLAEDINEAPNGKLAIEIASIKIVPFETQSGDADRDGDVDGADFLLLQRTNPAGIADWLASYPTNPLSAVSAVPEPAAAVLLLGMSVGLLCRRVD